MQIKLLLALFCFAGYVAAVDVVSLGVIVLAGIAIAKEKLIIAELHRTHTNHPTNRGRHRRDAQAVETTLTKSFDSLAIIDTDDCAKLLACHVFEKDESSLNEAEKKIKGLFADNLDHIDETTNKGIYLAAAKTGSLKQSGLCSKKYNKCFIEAEKLSEQAKHD